MDYKQAMDYINSYTKSGTPVTNLMRFRVLMQYLGNPQNNLRFIHIAGTNGKGSITEYCACMLAECGFTVGKFTSPFIVDFRERIQINDRYISEKILCTLCEDVKHVIEKYDLHDFSQFEIITAIGFLYFSAKSVDIVCMETGIGGTLDCTNIIEPPLVSVITTIDFDHTALLGNTIEQIAAAKAGIIKGTKCVSAPFQRGAAESVIRKQCEATGAEYIVPATQTVDIWSNGLDGSVFRYKEGTYKIIMCGKHQVTNAITAIEAVNALGLKLNPETIANGLARAKLPARLEKICDGLILDGAHNPSGMTVAQRVLSMDERKKVGVIGMINTKDYRESLKIILPALSEVVFTDGFAPNAVPFIDLREPADELHIKCHHVKNAADALVKAKELAGAEECIFCGGSLYLASELRKLLVK